MTGPELRTARRDLDLSQTALAEKWGLSKQTIGNWERGRQEVPKWVEDAMRGMEHGND